MTRPLKPVKESYTETEAAGYLNISIGELHALLDQHIFNDGKPRPEDISFCEADLALLGFWSRTQSPSARNESPKVIPMPRRREL
jgi:hypothetical protein